MSIVKPYTFTAGTKARANEVNANFDTLYSQVNLNISDIATNSNEIDNLENNKAEVNGSSTQRFAVADATSSSDAINKQTLEKAITPLFGYINGLTITKDSDSPNDTIIVDIGSCYDSTNSKVLVLDASVSKQNTNQGANTTYYVYIIGTSTGNTTDILISSTDVEPTLPTGYTLYRLIGSYTTDSDSNIRTIYSYSNTNMQSETFVSLSLNIGVGTTNLLTYLPVDDFTYSVWVQANIKATSNSEYYVRVNTDIFPTATIIITDGDNDRESASAGFAVVPVGKDRTITIANNGGLRECKLLGYMRV